MKGQKGEVGGGEGKEKIETREKGEGGRLERERERKGRMKKRLHWESNL